MSAPAETAVHPVMKRSASVTQLTDFNFMRIPCPSPIRHGVLWDMQQADAPSSLTPRYS